MPFGTSFFVTSRISFKAFTGATLVIAAFLLSRQYAGIRHDGILYAGDALAHIKPGQFHDDLYFLFGSQGAFTILPTLYASLIRWFGLGTGTTVGLLVAGALFLSASWALVRALAPRNLYFFCMLSVVLGWSLYGGRRVFAYSEPFLTSRSFAEPAVLFGLALLVRRRVVGAALVLLLAAFIHPLVFAGGAAIAWLWMVGEDRRWLWLAPLGVASLLGLGLAQLGPFTDVFQRYDDEWWALVQEVNVHAFVLNWMTNDFGVIVFDCVCIGLTLERGSKAPLDRLLRAALVVGLGCTLLSFLLVDVERNAFFGKLQIWRALWIMQWLAMATFPIALRRLWLAGTAGRVAACLLALGWLAPSSTAPPIVAVMAVVLYALRARIVISPLLVRITVGSVILCALIIGIQGEMRAIKLGGILDQPVENIVAQGLSIVVVVAALMLAVWQAHNRWPRTAVAAAGVLLIMAASFWDQRAAWTRTMEAYGTDKQIWPGLIEPGARVYWYRDLMAPWILLAHGNYYTAQQGSGAVFSRAMVLELDKRRKLTALLDFQEQVCRMMNGLNERQGACEPDVSAVQTLCTDGAIDYVVLQSTLEGAVPIADFSTGVVENGYEKKFFLYRCSALKSG